MASNEKANLTRKGLEKYTQYLNTLIAQGGTRDYKIEKQSGKYTLVETKTSPNGSTQETNVGEIDLNDEDVITELQSSLGLDNKVDKVEGKELSSNDLTDILKSNYDSAYISKHTHSNKVILDNITASYTSEEKIKLNGIATNANNYTHPVYSSKTNNLYKVTIDNTGHISNTSAVTKTDITNLGIPSQDTTYTNATSLNSGLMSAIDKNKLDNISNDIAQCSFELDGTTLNMSLLSGTSDGVNSQTVFLQENELKKTFTFNTFNITERFTFINNTAVKYGDGTTTTSSAFSCSEYVNVSDFSGQKMQISFPRYISSTVGRVGYGIAFYNIDKIYISGLQAKFGTNGMVDFTLNIPENAAYCRTTIINDYQNFYCLVGDIEDKYKNTPLDCELTVNEYDFGVRLGYTLNNLGDYISDSSSRSSNIIPIKNAKCILRSHYGTNIFILSDGSKIIQEDNKLTVPDNAVGYLFTTTTYDRGGWIKIKYDNVTDIDLSDYPLYFRISVNNTVISNDINNDNLVDVESIKRPLCIAHIPSLYDHSKENKSVLLNGGLGKKITLDGWLSNTDGWTTFISNLNTAGYVVFAVEGGRATNDNDYTYTFSNTTEHTQPSLGNPFISQATNQANLFLHDFLNLKIKIGIIGGSQGGINALNYQYLYGNVAAIVEMAGFVSYYNQGFVNQSDAIKKYGMEWYGFTGIDEYDESKTIGFDPYLRLITIGEKQYLQSAPIKFIYGNQDTTAKQIYPRTVYSAIKNAGGLTVFRTFPNATHSLAGGDSANANDEAIAWLNRFC